jgi:hypothetical protein
MKVRFLIVSALAALVGALVLVAPAAATTKYPSTVTIQQDRFGFHGTVSSPGPPACHTNRFVNVFRRTGSNNHLVGSDTTNSTGFWSVRATVHQGTYFAVVKRRVLPSRDAICQADVSPVITVGQ